MRYLNKIIFINSAHIPYAEIKLDGNVHFIGTQGVGKSTLLRAILFFYNVDKSKLGIRVQDKQKSYDEFYFPYHNSYIIYEISRENGNFFVITFVSNGRAAFRIVDSPYDKRFFIDEDNNARYEWGKISEQIGTKVFRSNIIRGYEEFRDIIYGNVQNVAKELRRFNLMESSRYQNVPRTIQNIFLNQSLESRVIKDTIIDSMDFARDSIDLNFYGDSLKYFRQQYEDIWKWFKKEKNGKIKVRVDAGNVIEKYSSYEQIRKTIKDLCAKLNYALNRDTEKLPCLENEIAAKAQELTRQKRLLAEENDKFIKERDELKGKEAVINEFLKQTKTKRQHYIEIDIKSIIDKMSKEKELHIRKDSLACQENILTDKNQSVKMRYDALMQEIDNSFKEFKLQAGQQINNIESQKTKDISIIQSEFNDRLTELDSDYQQKSNSIQADIDSAQQEKTELMLKKQNVQQTNPFENEISELTAQIEECERRRLSLMGQQASIKQEIVKVTNDTESKCKELVNRCEKEELRINNVIDGIKQEKDKLEQLLNRQKGSFIEWLDNNVTGWKDTLGKVVDDEVLYDTSLEPQKTENSETVYGVRIELQNISKTVKTPEELHLQIETLVLKLKEQDIHKAEIKQKLEEDINEMKRIPASKLKPLRLENINIEAELRQIPDIIERHKKGIADYKCKLSEWRKWETDYVLELLEKNNEQLKRLKALIEETNKKRQRETDELRKMIEHRKKEVEAVTNEKKNEISFSIQHQEAEATSHKRELEAQMDAELKGLGVDVNRLSEIRRELKSIEDDLYFIDKHKSDFYSWQKDNREYFDAESSKKNEKRLLINKLQDLQDKYDSRKKRKETDIRFLSDDLQSYSNEAEKLKESISNVRTFLSSESCPSRIDDAGVRETQMQLYAILNDLRDNIAGQQQKMEDFKIAVTVLKSNFSSQNTFHFRTVFNTESDYTEFASELNEFISNEKIEKYRMRTNSQYANIIKRIAKEVSDLNQHNAEIKSTINEINRDFRENNFAGVIKEIELRAVESSDRLMQQLLSIKKFDEEHGFDIGNLNLFSTEESLNRTNEEAVKLLMNFIEMMDIEKKRERITLSDTFKLEFKVKENDNDTNWVEKLSNVGSDGTDVLVKSMVNIMLINVFKRKISKRFVDFKLHCMMDEIGKLHPDNVAGILKFANVRNIFLINSSPTTYNAQVYKYTYSLSKDEKNNTIVKALLTIK